MDTYHPDIYVELHSYSSKNFDKLVSNTRIDDVGVPGFSILEENVLMGSSSPHIRKDHFLVETLCLTFEIERLNFKSKEFATKILDVVKESHSRDDFINYMMAHYPVVAKKAIEDYKRFYGS